MGAWFQGSLLMGTLTMMLVSQQRTLSFTPARPMVVMVGIGPSPRPSPILWRTITMSVLFLFYHRRPESCPGDF